MKKIVLLIVVVATLSLSSYAQGISWGPRVGVNVSSITNLAGDVTSTSARVRPNIGLFADYRLGTMFGVQVEAMYSMQGAKLNSKQEHGKWSLNYLNIPILAKFYVLGGLNIQAGVQFGFLIRSSMKYGNTIVTNFGQTRGLDFVVPIGVSYEFPMGLTFDARYGIDASRINKYSQPGYNNNRNSVFSFTFGWKF